MPTLDFYCRECNRRFNAESDSPNCPHCGQTVSAWRDQATIEAEVPRDNDPAQGEPPADALVGQRLGGAYLIEKFLGQGGMARVYRARHLTLERSCAVKVLRPSTASQAEIMESFLAEARAAAALVHPHAVTLHTIGNAPQGHYLEMEYVDGESLAHRLESAGRLDVTTATRFMLHISSALASAHKLGMIHRDIKPANVMVTRDGVAKLADFGLAKRLVARAGSQEAQLLAGTPHYMAPELFQGQPADKRSDVYAVGVTYFALLSGQLPIERTSLQELIQVHIQGTEVRWDTLDPAIGDSATLLLRRCLARAPQARYEDAVELHDEFRALYGSLRSPESLLQESLAGTGIAWEGAGQHFVLSVRLPDGRSQQVHVEACAGDAVAEQMIRIYSICAPVAESYLRAALELNAHLPYAAIAIQEIDRQPHFVMSNTYPRATCDPDEIRKSVLTIARHADAVEQRLTGRDRH